MRMNGRRMRTGGTAAGAVLLLALGALVVGGGCGRGDSPPSRQLVVIGIDAMDWIPADSLLAAGRMPHLQGLLAQGMRADMLSFVPLEKSPLLWASIATGLRPAQHGIGGFVREDERGGEQTPLRSGAWRAPAFWDVANATGLTSHVLGWWVTHPARTIDGVMVSDYLPWTAWRPLASRGLVAPDSLQDEVLALRVAPQAVTEEELGRFVDLAALRAAPRTPELERSLHELRSIWAADRSYLAIGHWLAQRGETDLFIIYLRGLDLICHEFWRYWQTDKSPTPLTPEQVAIFRRVVPEYYAWADEALGEILSWFPVDRQVVVLSDHGFHGPRLRKRGWTLGTEEHRREGIFVARGPLFAPGAGGLQVELLDIAPTLLALVGLPASAEMPGQVAAHAMNGAGRRLAARLEKHRVTSYASLAPAAAADTTGGDPAVDEDIRRQLRSLGYIK